MFQFRRIIIFVISVFLLNNNVSTYAQSQGALLDTQTRVDSFAALGHTYVSGNLSIGNFHGMSPQPYITDLSALSNLTSIDGDLYINGNLTLATLNGLQNIETISGNLWIWHNPLLENLTGLEGLETVNGDLNIAYNEMLKNSDGINNLNESGQITIMDNESLLELDGLNNLNDVNSISIINNKLLKTLNGFSNVDYVDKINISDNDSLFSYCGITNLVNNLSATNNYTINNNLYNPTIQDLLNGNCDYYVPFSIVENNPIELIYITTDPISKGLSCYLKGLNDVQLKVTNLLGQVVYQKQNINQSKFTFQIPEPLGLFILEIRTSTHSKIIKFVKG